MPGYRNDKYQCSHGVKSPTSSGEAAMKNEKEETVRTDGRQTIRVGIVGGGKGCYELLKLFEMYHPIHPLLICQ